MEVLVAGVAGGREHVLGEALAGDGEHNITFTHGNAGTAEVGINLYLDAPDVEGTKPGAEEVYEKILDYADPSTVDLAVVGPEAPLIANLAGRLRNQGVRVFGPDGWGAQAEGSKVWFAQFAHQYGIRQPDFKIISDVRDAADFMTEQRNPQKYVIKADGQAGGKGVILPKDDKEAAETFMGMLDGSMFGDAGRTVLAQSRLDPAGQELSGYFVMDGKQISLVGVAQDYKRVGEGDTGKNTGGMGAYSPVNFVTPRIKDDLLDMGDRFLDGMRRRYIDFRGVFFLGGMLDVENNRALNVLEANVRFGDPESQVVIPRLVQQLGAKGLSFYDLLEQAASGSLDPAVVGDISDEPADSYVSVCIATEDYPEKGSSGDVIYGLDRDYPGVKVYHGGTTFNEADQVVTNGGRILYVTSGANSLHAAQTNVLSAIGEQGIHFDGAKHRRDIPKEEFLV